MYFRFLNLIILLLVLIVSANHVEAAVLKSTYPKLANYFLSWTISDEQARDLAKWDILILDAEVRYRSPEALIKIRQLNPQVIILAYVPAAEIRADWPYLRQISPLRYKLGGAVFSDWYLKNDSGQRQTFWPGTYILNVTDHGPLVMGERWNDFLPSFVVREVLNNDIWDGVFYDNGWDNISHFAGGESDLDGDGIAEDKATADKLWQQGLKKIFQETRRLAPRKLVVENDGVIYAPNVDGVMLENFSSQKNWVTFANNLNRIKEASRKSLSILNANTQNTGQWNNWSAMRYGLTTSLLFGAAYSFDYGDQEHGQTWWYDEYNVHLGAPLSEARLTQGGRKLQPGLWRRDFQNGIVFLNSTASVADLRFNEEFEKIIGTQDRDINDGRIISDFSLPAYDGIILRRPLEKISDAAYPNGIFVRVFNIQGQAVRAGFFSYDAEYPSQIRIAEIDLNGDGRKEFVSSYKGILRVRSGSRTILISPFGAKWSGSLNFAFGDVNGDGVKEIVVTGEAGGGGEIRIYRADGELEFLPWKAFGAKYNGGADVAIGDLNGDGISEIIIGAGPGSGPQIRIFSCQGKLLSGGFFAYDPRFRGGVQVAAGDLNGDGRAEIITGPGVGGSPQINIFDSQGQMIFSFFAFDQTNKSGVKPTMTDIDGDGKMEILAGMTDFQF